MCYNIRNTFGTNLPVEFVSFLFYVLIYIYIYIYIYICVHLREGSFGKGGDISVYIYRVGLARGGRGEFPPGPLLN